MHIHTFYMLFTFPFPLSTQLITKIWLLTLAMVLDQKKSFENGRYIH